MQFLFFVLQLIQTIVNAAMREKLLMSALFTQAALMEHQNAIRILNGAETMRNHQRGAASQQLVQGFANQQFGLGGHARGGLVENQETRIVRQRSRKINQLTLPDRESRAALVSRSGDSFRKRTDKIAQTYFIDGTFHVFTSDSGGAKPNVRFDRSGEEERILQHDPEMTPQVLQVEQANVDAIQ